MRTCIIVLLFAFASCSKEKDQLALPGQDDQPVTLPNLIVNSGFETSGQPSFASWEYIYPPSSPDTFSTDVPPSGGSFSLRLRPEWFPAEGAVETYITGLNTTAQFLLRFYAKGINLPQGNAYASVYIKGTSLASTQAVAFSNVQWTQYSVTTPALQLTPGDTLAVRLSAGSTEVAGWEVLYDTIELYELP
jgi:hypothetical protein